VESPPIGAGPGRNRRNARDHSPGSPAHSSFLRALSCSSARSPSCWWWRGGDSSARRWSCNASSKLLARFERNSVVGRNPCDPKLQQQRAPSPVSAALLRVDCRLDRVDSSREPLQHAISQVRRGRAESIGSCDPARRLDDRVWRDRSGHTWRIA
jgi:hypothetical protein